MVVFHSHVSLPEGNMLSKLFEWFLVVGYIWIYIYIYFFIYLFFYICVYYYYDINGDSPDINDGYYNLQAGTIPTTIIITTVF